jgi:tetratricopeptide (TPR) repeat protein
MRLKAEQARTQAEKEQTHAELTRADGNLTVALAALDQIFMTEIEDRVRRERKLTQEDRRFLEKGLAFYERFAARNSAHGGLQTESARAYRRVGDLQLGLMHWPEAESGFRKAIPVFENIRVQSPDLADYHRELASSFEGLSRALWQQQRADEAIKASERALPYWEGLAASGTERPDVRFGLAHCLGQEALLLAHNGRYGEAEQTLTRVLDLFAKLKNEFPRDRRYRRDWAYTHSCLAGDVLHATKRLTEAEQHYHESIAAYRALAEEAPDDFWYPRCLGHELICLGFVLKDMGQRIPAEQLYRQAIEVQENILARDPPAINEHRHLLAQFVGHLAHFLAEGDRFSEAEAAFRRSATIRETIIADLVDPDDEQERQNQRRLISVDYVGLIQTFQLAAEKTATDRARPEDDRKASAAALRAHTREIERDATRAGHLAAGELNGLAWKVVVKKDSDAEDVACAVEMAGKAAELAPNDGNIWNTLGIARYRAGDFKQAVADLQKSTQLRNGGSSFDLFFLAMVHWQLGNKTEARNWYDQAVRWMEKNQPTNEELSRFRTEAAELLLITPSSPATQP